MKYNKPLMYNIANKYKLWSQLYNAHICWNTKVTMVYDLFQILKRKLNNLTESEINVVFMFNIQCSSVDLMDLLSNHVEPRFAQKTCLPPRSVYVVPRQYLVSLNPLETGDGYDKCYSHLFGTHLLLKVTKKHVLVILKRPLHSYYTILKKCFLGTINVLISVCWNLQAHTGVWPVAISLIIIKKMQL